MLVSFVMHSYGLHYHDTVNYQLSMVTTVNQYSEGFIQLQISQSKTARTFQVIICHPSTANMKAIIQGYLITNFPVTLKCMYCEENIYGTRVPMLKGKTTHRVPIALLSDYVKFPPQIFEANKHVTLASDVFFLNQVPFFETVSDHTKFTTAANILSVKAVQQDLPLTRI